MEGFWSKAKIVFIIVIFLVIIGLLFYGLYYLLFVSRTKPNPLGALYTTNDLSIAKSSNKNNVDYNLAYDVNPTDSNLDITGIKDNIINSLITDSLLTVPQITSSDLTRIIIPQLSINSAIVPGNDGEKALVKGFWLYPASSAYDGEKILLCHRRYWGPNNPNSCWYLDRLSKGSEIETIDKDGNIRKYSVSSVNQLDPNDPGIISLSNEDIIKLVTCAPLGHSTQRLVVIANRV